jgi:hypothetical protein
MNTNDTTSTHETILRKLLDAARTDRDNAVSRISKVYGENMRMREAIKSVVVNLRYINEADALWDIRDESRVALAKLQPFLTDEPS